MTNKEILDAALRQSAYENCCSPEDFFKCENVIVSHHLGEKARAYYSEPISCNFVTYGSNIVACVKDGFREIVNEYINRFEFYHCFETPNMLWLNEKLAPLGQKVCFMAEYYLPDVTKLSPLSCGYEMKILHKEDFRELYLPCWSNALCKERSELDVLGVGAYDNGKLIGFAACSADCETMWQIGIDVLPEYRRQGIASALTSRLALEIISAGKVPFYCSAWSNIRSVRNGIKSGFIPAWAEMTVKPAEKVDGLNRKK